MICFYFVFQIPEYTEIVLVAEREQHNLYPGLYIFSTPCRFVRQIKNNQNMSYELIGTFEQLTIQINLFSKNVRVFFFLTNLIVMFLKTSKKNIVEKFCNILLCFLFIK